MTAREPASEAATSAIRVSSTSRHTASIDPITLRETSTTRLIFRPLLLDNSGNPEAQMNGAFVYQRKTPTDEWGDVTALPLSKLKATEWIKLELGAAELLTLFNGLGAYYELVRQHGLLPGTREYIPAPRSRVLRSIAMSADELDAELQDEETASALLRGLVRWIAANERAVAAALWDGISLEHLQQFDAVLALARLQRFCRELDDNRDNPDEAYWQKTLKDNGWALAQIYAFPLMLIQSQVYVGGKALNNRMGNTADFLSENRVTGNVVLVEIKTPATPLLNRMYRNNVVNVSEDLSGGLLQILNARQNLVRNYADLAGDELVSRRPLSPRGLLIIGSATQLSGHAQKASFELFRNNQRDIDIVTFDEVRGKVEMVIELLKNVSK